MAHIKLKIINGCIYAFIGMCMIIGAMEFILRYKVRSMDVSDGYTLSVYVTDTMLLKNGLGLVLVFGGILLIVKGLFMVLHANIDKNSNRMVPPPHPVQ